MQALKILIFFLTQVDFFNMFVNRNNKRILIMNELTNCPYCSGDFIIREVECQGCKTQIKSNFKVNRFHMFKPDDLYFIEVFLKNEGNIKLVEKDLGISYPTVKSRLKNIVNTLGYRPKSNDDDKMKILNSLSEGEIDVNEALKNLGNTD